MTQWKATNQNCHINKPISIDIEYDIQFERVIQNEYEKRRNEKKSIEFKVIKTQLCLVIVQVVALKKKEILSEGKRWNLIRDSYINVMLCQRKTFLIIRWEQKTSFWIIEEIIKSKNSQN